MTRRPASRVSSRALPSRPSRAELYRDFAKHAVPDADINKITHENAMR